ncbi:ABC transporter permease [Terasakiella pusilla]|uniref:ABC transporter permease n=1 Tax=Terasakiella pusilla TaxID=64973 RepID=UPI003AA9D3FA
MSRPPSVIFALLNEAFMNLVAAAQRSVLALLGIVIGTASVIAMMNVGHNAEVESVRQFEAMGTNLMAVQNLGDERFASLSVAMIERIPEARPEIQRVAALFISNLRLGRGKGVQSTVIGATQSIEPLIRLEMDEGRFLSDFDQEQTFAVIGADLAADGDGEGPSRHVGDQIRMGAYIFTIIGVLRETPRNPLLFFDVNKSVFIPQTSLRRVVSNGGSPVILAEARDGVAADTAALAMEKHLQSLLAGQPPQIQTARQLIETMQNQVSIISGLLAAVGSISLVVGGVGVMNVMLMNIAERKREIGLRMALGARRSQVRMMFLMEATMLSLTGGVCGTVLGTLFAYVYVSFSGWTFEPSALAFVLGAVISAGVGLFFSAYPATIAARLDPIESLRAE